MTNPTLFFILLLTIWPTQIFSLNQTHGPDLIIETCKKALYRDVCISSLKLAPYDPPTNVHDLAVIALKLAVSNATEISHHISELLNSTSDSVVEECLTDCYDNYLDAVDQLDDSIAALDSKGYSDVNTWVTAAMSDAESCEEGFREQAGHASPITSRNKTFNQLCSNVLAIVNVLAGSA